MKAIHSFATVFVLMMAIAASCQKEASGTRDKTTVSGSKSQVSPGESIQFTVKKGTTGAVSKWTVSPATNVQISRPVSWDQTNTIRFNQAGTYTVNVELKKVWCDSVAASHPGMDTCLNSGTVTATASTIVEVKN